MRRVTHFCGNLPDIDESLPVFGCEHYTEVILAAKGPIVKKHLDNSRKLGSFLPIAPFGGFESGFRAYIVETAQKYLAIFRVI